MRRVLGDLAESPGVARAAELVIKAGRPDGGTGPLRRDADAAIAHGADGAALASANLLREHRGDGHVAALVTVGIGGTEAHVLHALSEGMSAEQFGRVGHLPRAQLAAVVDAMRARGLIGADGWLTVGRQIKERVETLTDELAAPGLRHSRAGRTRPAHRGPRAPCRSPRRRRFAASQRRLGRHAAPEVPVGDTPIRFLSPV